MKTVGILGGIGPEGTFQLVNNIIDKFATSGNSFRPSILAEFLPVNLVEEEKFVRSNIDGNFEILLVDGAIKLEKGGADFLVIACNSAHKFVNQIQKNINIPILSLHNELNSFLNIHRLTRLGIVGSRVAVSGLFKFEKNIELVAPDKENQKMIESEILKVTNGGKVNLHNFEVIFRKWRAQGVKNILVACSDLKFDFSGVRIIDTMDVLAEAVVNHL